MVSRGRRAARSGSGARSSSSRVSLAARVVEGLQGGGEEFPQHRPQSQDLASAIPDQALMSPGQQFHCFGGRAVASDLPVVVVVQTHDLGQHVSIPGVGLRTRGGMPLSIPGRRHRIDGINLITGCEQRLNPGAAISLDPNPDSPCRLHRFQI